MILPGETEAGTAGTQPCRGISRWAHRDDERGRESSFLRRPTSIGSKDPHALKIPARRAEYSLTENVASPFQAEPRQDREALAGILSISPYANYLPRIQRGNFPVSEFILRHEIFSRLRILVKQQECGDGAEDFGGRWLVLHWRARPVVNSP